MRLFLYKAIFFFLYVVFLYPITLQKNKEVFIDLTQKPWCLQKGESIKEVLSSSSCDKITSSFPIFLEEIFSPLEKGKLYYFLLQTSFSLPPLKEYSGYSLLLMHIGENWKIYLNKKLLHEEFYIQGKKILIRRSIRGVLIPIPPSYLNPGKNTLEVLVAGETSLLPFIVANLDIGFRYPSGYQIASIATNLKKVQEPIENILVYVYLLFGIYQLLLFGLNREEKCNLFFALFCIALSSYFFTRRNDIFALTLDTSLWNRVEHLSLSLTTLFFLLFLIYFLPTKLPIWAKRYHQVLIFSLIGISFLLLISPFLYLEGIAIIWHYITLLILPYLGIHLFFAIRNKTPYAIPFIIGFTPFLITVLIDLLQALLFHTGEGLSTYGFIGMVFFMMGILAYKTLKTEKKLSYIEKELSYARILQDFLLPSPQKKFSSFQIDGYTFASFQLSGDFYEYFFPSRNQVGILVADVSGHGISAAILSSMLKLASSILAPYAGDPSRLMKELYKLLSPYCKRHFITVGYLLLNLSKKKGTYVRAGHEPLLYIHPQEKKVYSYLPKGVLITDLTSPHYEEIHFPIEKKSKYLLYTDGLIEVRNPEGEFLGRENLIGFLEKNSHLPISSLLKELVDFTFSFSRKGPSSIEDDITLLGVEAL